MKTAKNFNWLYLFGGHYPDNVFPTATAIPKGTEVEIIEDIGDIYVTIKVPTYPQFGEMIVFRDDLE
jgi:hypothetical protein